MKKSIRHLKPHPLNAEIYQLSCIEQLADSIDQVGLLEPLVVNSKNQVISGHRRLQAIKQLGWKSVEVIVRKDIAKDNEAFYLVQYNQQRIKLASEQLKEILVLLDHFKEGPGTRTDLTAVNVDRGSAKSKVARKLGMSYGNIYKLLFIHDNCPELMDHIDAGRMTINQAHLEAKRQISFQSVVGKTNGNGHIPIRTNTSDRYVIYNKSSERMDELQNESLNLVITSPPYYGKRNYGIPDQIGLESTIEDYLDSLEQVFAETRRVLKEDGALFVVVGDTYVDGCLQSIPHRLALRLMDLGYIQRNCLVWKKINPKPEGTTKRWSTSTEFVFFFTKSLNHRFDVDAIRVPYKDDALSNPPRHRKLNGQMQLGTSNLHHPLGKVPSDYIETNVASIHLDEDIEHPAMFPEELIEPFVKATTEKNDRVLDVFAGSGTTGVVALDLGRRFVGYEINGAFCKLSEQRLGSLNEVENTL
jgi:site-specific DNA-methyltransferase (adenine-specific)